MSTISFSCLPKGFNAQHAYDLTLKTESGPFLVFISCHSFSIFGRVDHYYDGLDCSSLCLRIVIVLQMLWM